MSSFFSVPKKRSATARDSLLGERAAAREGFAAQGVVNPARWVALNAPDGGD